MIVILAVAVAAAQEPDAAIEFVTVYVPAVLAARSISPVFALTKTNPEVELNVPAVPPEVNVGEGLVPL